MSLLYLVCSNCSKKFLRDLRHVNENKKLNQKPFCSLHCLGKSHLKARIQIICENTNCKKKFERLKKQLSSHNYCSHSCAAKVSNVEREKKIRNCASISCLKEFTGDRKYCSLLCVPHRESKYTRQIILTEIRIFAERHGRIPTKQDLMKIYAPSRKHFTTWNNVIIAAGYKPNPVMFAKKHIANDGHKCDSLAEKIIDDWLYTRKINHKRWMEYPGNSSFTEDFVVGDHWIEFFGLFGEHKRYDELRQEKIELAKQHKLKLIQIYPHHLFPKNQLAQIFAPIQRELW